MLVLSRRVKESIRIGEDVRITVVHTSGRGVRLAIEAPSDVPVHREEVLERIIGANRDAAQSAPAEADAEGGGEQ